MTDTNLAPVYEGLTALQIRAAELYHAGEMTNVRICEEIGIGRSTLWSWTQKEPFTDALAAMAEATWNLAMRRLRAATGLIVDSLILGATTGPKSQRAPFIKEALNRLDGDPSRPQVNIGQQQAMNLTDLSAETKKRVLQELGGPTDLVDMEDTGGGESESPPHGARKHQTTP